MWTWWGPSSSQITIISFSVSFLCVVFPSGLHLHIFKDNGATAPAGNNDCCYPSLSLDLNKGAVYKGWDLMTARHSQHARHTCINQINQYWKNIANKTDCFYDFAVYLNSRLQFTKKGHDKLRVFLLKAKKSTPFCFPSWNYLLALQNK